MRKYITLYFTFKERLDRAEKLEALFKKHRKFEKENQRLKEANYRRIQGYGRLVAKLKRRTEEEWRKSLQRHFIRAVPGVNVEKATLNRDGQ
mgnify:FL=1